MATESTEGHGKIKHKNINLWLTVYPCPFGRGSTRRLMRCSFYILTEIGSVFFGQRQIFPGTSKPDY
jgi:hypothetical protein